MVKGPSPYKADSGPGCLVGFSQEVTQWWAVGQVLSPWKRPSWHVLGSRERGLHAQTGHLPGPEAMFLGVTGSESVTSGHAKMSHVARRDMGDLGQGTTACIAEPPVPVSAPCPRQYLSHSLHVPRRGCQHMVGTQET